MRGNARRRKGREEREGLDLAGKDEGLRGPRRGERREGAREGRGEGGKTEEGLSWAG